MLVGSWFRHLKKYSNVFEHITAMDYKDTRRLNIDCNCLY